MPKWLEYIQDWLPEGAMKVDGFDDCICGIVERYGMDSVLLYDTDTMIEKMITNDGMDYEDAVDKRDHILFHSALSPQINLGLLTHEEIISKINRIIE